MRLNLQSCVALLLTVVVVGNACAGDWRNSGAAAALTVSITGHTDGQAPSTQQKPRFVVGTGVSANCVTDQKTGLMWLRNPDTTKLNWASALEFCDRLDGASGRGGYSDWRLPGLHELVTVTERNDQSPFVAHSSLYWTGTWLAMVVPPLRITYLDLGAVLYADKATRCCVWPVRGGHHD